MATAKGIKADEERIALYLLRLRDMTDELLAAACGMAIDRCQYFPQLNELKDFAIEFALEKHRRKAKDRAKLDVTPAPQEFNFKLDDLYAEIDNEREELRQKDLRLQITREDRDSINISDRSVHCRCPKHQVAHGRLFYVCLLRIQDAQRGVPIRSARCDAEQLGRQYEITVPSGEAGASAMEDE